MLPSWAGRLHREKPAVAAHLLQTPVEPADPHFVSMANGAGDSLALSNLALMNAGLDDAAFDDAAFDDGVGLEGTMSVDSALVGGAAPNGAAVVDADDSGVSAAQHVADVASLKSLIAGFEETTGDDGDLDRLVLEVDPTGDGAAGDDPKALDHGVHSDPGASMASDEWIEELALLQAMSDDGAPNNDNAGLLNEPPHPAGAVGVGEYERGSELDGPAEAGPSSFAEGQAIDDLALEAALADQIAWPAAEAMVAEFSFSDDGDQINFPGALPRPDTVPFANPVVANHGAPPVVADPLAGGPLAGGSLGGGEVPDDFGGPTGHALSAEAMAGPPQRTVVAPRPVPPRRSMVPVVAAIVLILVAVAVAFVGYNLAYGSNL